MALHLAAYMLTRGNYVFTVYTLWKYESHMQQSGRFLSAGLKLLQGGKLLSTYWRCSCHWFQ